MVILRFKIHSKPDKSDEVQAALAEIIPSARATQGVISLDIARDLLDPDALSRPGSMRTGPLSNGRSRLQRYTGPWRSFRSRWSRRPNERSTTRRSTQRLSDGPPAAGAR